MDSTKLVASDKELQVPRINNRQNSKHQERHRQEKTRDKEGPRGNQKHHTQRSNPEVKMEGLKGDSKNKATTSH
eukprot:3711272-Prorocentrum_lima.AAC.1